MTNNLLKEDEDFLELIENDRLIEPESVLKNLVVQNDEKMLAYSIEGLYSNEKETKYLSRRKLKKNPPKLILSSGDGDYVEINLTKEFTKLLNKSLSEVDKVYMGKTYPINTDDDKKSFITKIKQEVKYNPIRFSTSIFIVFILLYILIVK